MARGFAVMLVAVPQVPAEADGGKAQEAGPRAGHGQPAALCSAQGGTLPSVLALQEVEVPQFICENVYFPLCLKG